MFSGSGIAYYGCSDKSMCSLSGNAVVVNLSRVGDTGLGVLISMSATCCYTNNCNGVSTISANKILFLSTTFLITMFLL